MTFVKITRKCFVGPSFGGLLIPKFGISDVGIYEYLWPIDKIFRLLKDRALISKKKLFICSFIRFSYFICSFVIIEMLYIVM
jgi:hypothetical protein